MSGLNKRGRRVGLGRSGVDEWMAVMDGLIH